MYIHRGTNTDRLPPPPPPPPHRHPHMHAPTLTPAYKHTPLQTYLKCAYSTSTQLPGHTYNRQTHRGPHSLDTILEYPHMHIHTRTHARMYAHTLARTHTRTHTHTHTHTLLSHPSILHGEIWHTTFHCGETCSRTRPSAPHS